MTLWLADVSSWCCSLDYMDFSSEFGLSSCLMRACFCYFYFLEGEWSDTFYILLSSLLTTSYQDILVIWHACCASTFLVIPGALAWRALGIPWFPFPGFLLLLHWRLVSVNFGHYLAHFLGVSTSFFSTVSYHIPWRSLECLFDWWGAWPAQGACRTRHDWFSHHNIFCNRQTSYVGHRFCQTTLLLLFDW